jgi:hypothetical protein
MFTERVAFIVTAQQPARLQVRDDECDEVVQTAREERRLLRRDYEGHTLREHFGLPRMPAMARTLASS